jgi:predicted dehydrogenase
MLRLGIIGLSPGNGHPYSWSAICNGYEPIPMESCGFPVIPRYLEKRSFPADQIEGVKVTHVWAQETALARHVALAARIDTVVDRYQDMLGQVDAVLLARDDAERHVEFATPFLEAGMPIYIDKPLALTCAEGRHLFTMQRYPGQLFTCSALRYAREFQLSSVDRASIGEIRQIHATTPKDWDKYAVHVIEPALLLLGEDMAVLRTHCWREGESTTLAASVAGGRQLLVSALGAVAAPLALRVIGDKGWKDLVFHDAFSAFRSALQAFVDSVRARSPAISEGFVMDVVALIEAGRTP